MSYQRILLDYVDGQQLHTGLFERVGATYKRWREHLSQREVLAQLDARMLQDLGITPSDVWRETRNQRWFI
jgi:uncharacterized protein YjiS (DUF1127 family)